MKKPLLGFVPEPITVGFEKLLPSRVVSEGVALSRKFKQIRASIGDVGLIEPLSIAKADRTNGMHLLLDGHVRLLALKDLGFESATCLIANDDETYTYNNRVNRLSTVQEHLMIRRAVETGAVTPARLAKSLEVDVGYITKKLSLLDGICDEAVALLKDRNFSTHISQLLRKMKPMRQVECVELMVMTNNLTMGYAHALLAATPPESLVDPKKPRSIKGVTSEQMALMQREMDGLEGKLKFLEQSYGQDVLNLVLVKGYLNRLLGNEAVIRFLAQRQPDVLQELSTIAKSATLDR